MDATATLFQGLIQSNLREARTHYIIVLHRIIAIRIHTCKL